MYKEDTILISSCVKQDRKAQRELYERYSSRMFSVCVRYAADRDLAKDLLQDGFITVFAKIGSYNGDGSFEGWMRKIFVNTSLMELRKKDALKNAKDVDDAAVTANIASLSVDNVLEKLEGKDVLRYISQMPAGFRMVFNLSVFEGFSHQEIAKELKISEGTSRSQLSRARIWLQEKILKMEEFGK